MTRTSRRSSTGSSRRLPARLLTPIPAIPAIPAIAILGLAIYSGLVIPASEAQRRNLSTLRFPATDVVGPWVSYRIRTQSGSRPVREYSQRVAIVSREEYEGRLGFWVELKTTGSSGGTRIERGFFVEPESEADTGAEVYRLSRYQVLTPGGKLFEYPLGAAFEPRAGADVATFELFEFDPSVPPVETPLGPDTLRMGNRVVPTVAERTCRIGSDDWSDPDDSTHTNRLLLIQTYWRNSAVPITGVAKSLFQVTSLRYIRAPGDSATASVPGGAAWSPPDSVVRATAAAAAVAADSSTGSPPDRAGAPRIISWTELELLDLGSDAVPEVTQKSEPLPPEESAPAPSPVR